MVVRSQHLDPEILPLYAQLRKRFMTELVNISSFNHWCIRTILNLMLVDIVYYLRYIRLQDNLFKKISPWKEGTKKSFTHKNININDINLRFLLEWTDEMTTNTTSNTKAHFMFSFFRCKFLSWQDFFEGSCLLLRKCVLFFQICLHLPAW